MDNLTFVKEGELKEPKKRYKLHAYLFNDLLIIAKLKPTVSFGIVDTKNVDYVVKYVIPTESLVVWKLDESQSNPLVSLSSFLSFRLFCLITIFALKSGI
jgi:hypothetical protein